MPSLVTLYGLSKKYGRKTVLDSLSMEIDEGDSFLVLGANGAGKTTLFRIISGLVNEDGGRMLFRGEAAKKGSKCPITLGGFIDEPAFYPEESGIRHLRDAALMRGIAWDKALVLRIAADFGLDEEDLAKKVSRCSMGMKKRLAIARSMLKPPQLLILDEPTNGLDPLGVKQLRDSLLTARRKYGATILFSSHVIAEAKSQATKIGILSKGRLVKVLDRRAPDMASWRIVFTSEQEAEKAEKTSARLTGMGIRRRGAELECPLGDRDPAALLGEIVAAGFGVREFYRSESDIEREFLEAISDEK